MKRPAAANEPGWSAAISFNAQAKVSPPRIQKIVKPRSASSEATRRAAGAVAEEGVSTRTGRAWCARVKRWRSSEGGVRRWFFGWPESRLGARSLGLRAGSAMVISNYSRAHLITNFAAARSHRRNQFFGIQREPEPISPLLACRRGRGVH